MKIFYFFTVFAEKYKTRPKPIKLKNMSTNEENELNAIQESLQRTYTTVTDEVNDKVTKGQQIDRENLNGAIEIQHQSSKSLGVKMPQIKPSQTHPNMQLLLNALHMSKKDGTKVLTDVSNQNNSTEIIDSEFSSTNNSSDAFTEEKLDDQLDIKGIEGISPIKIKTEDEEDENKNFNDCSKALKVTCPIYDELSNLKQVKED